MEFIVNSININQNESIKLNLLLHDFQLQEYELTNKITIKFLARDNASARMRFKDHLMEINVKNYKQFCII